MGCDQDRVYCDGLVMIGFKHVAMLDGVEKTDFATIHRRGRLISYREHALQRIDSDIRHYQACVGMQEYVA